MNPLAASALPYHYIALLRPTFWRFRRSIMTNVEERYLTTPIDAGDQKGVLSVRHLRHRNSM